MIHLSVLWSYTLCVCLLPLLVADWLYSSFSGPPISSLSVLSVHLCICGPPICPLVVYPLCLSPTPSCSRLTLFFILWSLYLFSISVYVFLAISASILFCISILRRLPLTPSSRRPTSSDCLLVDYQSLTPSSNRPTLPVYIQGWTPPLPEIWPSKTGHKHTGKQPVSRRP